jgi:hypothetical protein
MILSLHSKNLVDELPDYDKKSEALSALIMAISFSPKARFYRANR